MPNKQYNDVSNPGNLQDTDIWAFSRAPHTGATSFKTTPLNIKKYLNSSAGNISFGDPISGITSSNKLQWNDTASTLTVEGSAEFRANIDCQSFLRVENNATIPYITVGDDSGSSGFIFGRSFNANDWFAGTLAGDGNIRHANTANNINIGVGSGTPQIKISNTGLTFNDNVVVYGAFGSGADIGSPGAGTRMLFNPKKAAFRAGFVSGTQWDDANVGIESIAVGINAIASGGGAIALGAALGGTHTASGNNSIVLGNDCNATANRAVAIGDTCTASAGNAFAIGDQSQSSGLFSWALGNRAVTTHSNAFLISASTGGSTNYSSVANNSFGVRAEGGFYFNATAAATLVSGADFNFDSITGALLSPRQTTTQRTAYTMPNGSLVYDTTLNSFVFRQNSVDVSVTDANTASAIIKRDPSGNFGAGMATLSSVLMGTSAASRLLVLYNQASDNNQYYGFGIAAGTLKYQTYQTSSNHIFYASTSSSASNEVCRIGGNGVTLIGSGSSNPSLNVGTNNINLGYSTSAGTYFTAAITGDFNIRNVDTTKNINIGIFSGTPQLKISNAAVTLSTDLFLPTTGGTPSAFNYCEQLFTHTMVMNCPDGTTHNFSIKCGRLGKQVSLTWATLGVTATTATTFSTSSSPLPSRFCPVNDVEFPVTVQNNSAKTFGRMVLDSSGNITVYSDGAGSNFLGSGTASIINGAAPSYETA